MLSKILRNYITLFLLIVLLGVVCLYFSVIYHDKQPLPSRMLDHLGAALIVVGTIGVYEKLVSEQFFLGEVNSLMKDVIRFCNIKEVVLEFGIEEASLDSRKLSSLPFLTNSHSLALVFNDASKWISVNFEVIEARFRSRKHELTELFVIDPLGAFVEPLAKKCGDPADRVRDKVGRAVTDLKSMFAKARGPGILRIYYMKHFPTQTVFLGDQDCAITLYCASGERLAVPLIVGRQTQRGLFDFLRSDVSELRSGSQCVFDSAAPIPPLQTTP